MLIRLYGIVDIMPLITPNEMTHVHTRSYNMLEVADFQLISGSNYNTIRLYVVTFNIIMHNHFIYNSDYSLVAFISSKQVINRLYLHLRVY